MPMDFTATTAAYSKIAPIQYQPLQMLRLVQTVLSWNMNMNAAYTAMASVRLDTVASGEQKKGWKHVEFRQQKCNSWNFYNG